MFRINTKRIGNIGEAKVLAKFVELGIPVYIPFGDNERADMIAEFDGKLQKIQVKTSVGSKDGQVTFSLVSSTRHCKNGLAHKYTSSEVDYFALYSLQRDCVYLLKVPEEPLRSVAIRYEPAKNGQSCGVRFEKEMLIERVLCVSV